MAPFRLGHDGYQHELPWAIDANGPVTMYCRRVFLDEDVAELGLRLRGSAVQLRRVEE
jgi:hypothetical protein